MGLISNLPSSVPKVTFCTSKKLNRAGDIGKGYNWWEKESWRQVLGMMNSSANETLSRRTEQVSSAGILRIP